MYKLFALPLSLLVLTSVAFTAEKEKTNSNSGGDWKPLFDGKSTAGWRTLGKDAPPAAGWVVEDGTLKLDKKSGKPGGNIVTEESFNNFELSWEWNIAPVGNSGLKYNLLDPKKDLGCEYQMLDDEHHPDGVRGGKLHQTASLYDLIEPSDARKVKPPGEWNQSRLVVKGNHVEHWLNGVMTVSYEFGSEDLKARVAKSKYKANANFAEKRKSPILFQDHGDSVSLRDIKIRSLAD